MTDFDTRKHYHDPQTQADLNADPVIGRSKSAPSIQVTTELPPGVSALGAAPVPRPLPSSLLPVASFDMALMPDKLRPWAADLAERMQCPADYIGVSLMVSAAAVIGRKIAVRPLAHDDWTVVCNQWG